MALRKVEFTIFRDVNATSDDDDAKIIESYGLFCGVQEIASKLASKLGGVCADELRVFSTEVEARNPSENGDSLPEFCSFLSQLPQNGAEKLKSFGFSLKNMETVVCAFVRPELTTGQVASNSKPGVKDAERATNNGSDFTQPSENSKRRDRLTDANYSLIDHNLTLIWPRSQDGKPLKARNRGSTGTSVEEASEENATKEPIVIPPWVKVHLLKSFTATGISKEEGQRFLEAAIKMAARWRSEMAIGNKKEAHNARVLSWEQSRYGVRWRNNIYSAPGKEDDFRRLKRDVPGHGPSQPVKVVKLASNPSNHTAGLEEKENLLPPPAAQQQPPRSYASNLAAISPLDQAMLLKGEHQRLAAERRAAKASAAIRKAKSNGTTGKPDHVKSGAKRGRKPGSKNKNNSR